MTGTSPLTSGVCAARCRLALGALATSVCFYEFWRLSIIAATLPLLAIVDCRRIGPVGFTLGGGVIGALLSCNGVVGPSIGDIWISYSQGNIEYFGYNLIGVGACRACCYSWVAVMRTLWLIVLCVFALPTARVRWNPRVTRRRISIACYYHL